MHNKMSSAQVSTVNTPPSVTQQSLRDAFLSIPYWILATQMVGLLVATVSLFGVFCLGALKHTATMVTAAMIDLFSTVQALIYAYIGGTALEVGILIIGVYSCMIIIEVGSTAWVVKHVFCEECEFFAKSDTAESPESRESSRKAVYPSDSKLYGRSELAYEHTKDTRTKRPEKLLKKEKKKMRVNKLSVGNFKLL